MTKILSTLFVLMLTIGSVLAQDRTITGKVTSGDDGAPLPGVNVVIKNTTNGTTSDADGKYSLNVSDNVVLVFSFVGYSVQEIPIGNRNTIDVVLQPDVTQLQEVVTTAYGQVDKRSLSGSIAVVKGDVIADLPVQSLDRAIQGRLAGVQVNASSGQPGGALTVRVRGTGSITAGNNPLYIVDGVQVAGGGLSGQASSNALASINPNDIESIEVLKDAATAAIYGAQAANGVVLITTKKGKAGKTKVLFSGQEGLVNALNPYDIMNANELALLKAEAYVNNPTAIPGVTTPQQRRDAAYAIFGNPEDPNLRTYDWFDAIYHTGKLRQYDLSVSGGDAKTSFFVSGSYVYQQAQVIKSDYRRLTARLNLTHKISSKFTLTANLSLANQNSFGTISDGNFVNSPFVQPYLIRPNVPIYNDDGTYNQNLFSSFAYNIVQGVNEEVRTGKSLQTVSNLSVTYNIFKGLSFTSFYGVDFADVRDDNQRPQSIPAFAANGGTSLVVNTRNTDFNTSQTFNYDRKFADKHNVGATAGYEYKTQNFESASATASGFPNSLFRSLQNGSPLTVAGFFTGYKRNSVFGQLRYDYAGKYFVSGTLRRDGHSRFGADNRFGTFYGISTGWRLSNEGFLKNVSFISDMKIRASYGVTGNSEIADFSSRALFGAGGRYGNPQANGIRPTQLGNDLLTWEKAKTFNLGLDFGFFSNRLYGSVDAYSRTNDDLLLSTQLPADAGFTSINKNVGAVLNEGLELELGGVPFNKGGFKWESSFNISFQRNKIKRLTGTDQLTIGATRYFVGQPIDVIYSYRWAGVNPADGRPMWLDTLGNLTYNVQARDLAIVGKRFADFYGGFTNAFSYKGLRLDVFFQYQYGNDIFNAAAATLENSGNLGENQNVNQLGRWQKPGDITSFPQPYHNGQYRNNAGGVATLANTGSSRYIEDASYIRLKQVTLSYMLPASLLNKIKISSVKIYGQGLNLLTFTNYTGVDPEVPTGLNEVGTYPQSIQYSIGVQIGL